MFTRNAIWIGRTQGVGVLSADEAINYSLSGPMLRASGVDYDVRKDRPYLDYETYDFDVPVGEHGDIYDRYRVRLEEMSQSNRILEQALDRLGKLQGAPINVDDPRVILPPKSRAMSDMEAMIFHFKQVMEGVKPPVGEAYLGVENPKGELGYYFVSDGTAKPVRWRIRPPSFINLSSLPQDVRGRAAVRRHRHQRERGHRDGRDRPMSRAHAAAAAPCAGRAVRAGVRRPDPRAPRRALHQVSDQAGVPAAGALDGAGGARLDLRARRSPRSPRCWSSRRRT